MAKCDAVVVYWGKASEVWLRFEAARLKEPALEGKHRSLIAGPPAAPHKNADMLRLIFREGPFDKVVLVEKGPPTREILAELAPDGREAKS